MKMVSSRHGRWGRRRVHRLGIVLIVFGCTIGLIGLTFFRCRPIMIAFAESQAVWEATKIANRSVARTLQEYADLCTDTIEVVYTDDQRIASVSTNATAVNTIRTAMAEAAMSTMEQASSLSVNIPMGTLSGWHWLSGFGPLLTFPISFTATVVSDVSSVLEAVGINQSIYRVLVHLEISIYVVSPGGRSTVGANVAYPMAEAVLLGEVPDNLTEVYGDDQSLMGQIFDYGTMT